MEKDSIKLFFWGGGGKLQNLGFEGFQKKLKNLEIEVQFISGSTKEIIFVFKFSLSIQPTLLTNHTLEPFWLTIALQSVLTRKAQGKCLASLCCLLLG